MVVFISNMESLYAVPGSTSTESFGAITLLISLEERQLNRENRKIIIADTKNSFMKCFNDNDYLIPVWPKPPAALSV